MFEFKRLQLEDIEWARELHNDPEVIANLTDPHEVSMQEQLQWFFNLEKSKKSVRWVVWQDQDKIGLVRLDQIDDFNHSVCVGKDIHKDFRGKGLATPIYEALIEKLFHRFHRLWLEVAEYNHRAIHLYRKLGFIEEGRQYDALWKNFKYYDYISMYILNPNTIPFERGLKIFPKK